MSALKTASVSAWLLYCNPNTWLCPSCSTHTLARARHSPVWFWNWIKQAHHVRAVERVEALQCPNFYNLTKLLITHTHLHDLLFKLFFVLASTLRPPAVQTVWRVYATMFTVTSRNLQTLIWLFQGFRHLKKLTTSVVLCPANGDIFWRYCTDLFVACTDINCVFD